MFLRLRWSSQVVRGSNQIHTPPIIGLGISCIEKSKLVACQRQQHTVALNRFERVIVDGRLQGNICRCCRSIRSMSAYVKLHSSTFLQCIHDVLFVSLFSYLINIAEIQPFLIKWPFYHILTSFLWFLCGRLGVNT